MAPRLDASQIKAGKRVSLNVSECDLHAITLQALEELSAVFTDRFVLKAEGVLNLVADPIGLRRIVENLASNAAAPELFSTFSEFSRLRS